MTKYLLHDGKSENGLLRKLLFVLTAVVALAAICTAIYFGVKYHQLPDRVQHQTDNDTAPTTDNLLAPTEGKIIATQVTDKLRLVTRKEWLAQPRIQPGDPLKHPVPYVVIVHTSRENCATLPQCVFFVRRTQAFHMESKGWWDIGYNFLVGGDGNAYEGRGWDTIGAFAFGYNNVSIGISFIGTFIHEVPPEKQIAAGKALIAEGVRLGKISKDYKLFAHRQLAATESPGKAFYENIKTWDHWSAKP